MSTLCILTISCWEYKIKYTDKHRLESSVFPYGSVYDYGVSQEIMVSQSLTHLILTVQYSTDPCTFQNLITGLGAGCTVVAAV